MLKKLDNSSEFEGVKLSGGDTGFASARQDMIGGLTRSLTKRFEDVGDGLFNATSITNLAFWPTDKENLDGKNNCL